MYNLSVKEKKLLYYLSKNARESHTKIAKYIGVNKGTVADTIKRLQKDGIIKKFTSIINVGAIEATSFTLLLKFNKNLQKNKEIIDYFVNHLFSIWVVSLSGNYDLFVEFAVKDISSLERMMTEIRDHFQADLNHYKLDLFARNLRSSQLIADVYKGLELQPLPIKDRKYKEKKLDTLDKKILHGLTAHSNKSLVEIATEVGSTWDVVRYRIKLLEQAKIILTYFPQIDYKKLGYVQFICNIELRNIGLEDFKKFENIMKTNPNTFYAFTSANSPSILFHCAFKSIEELDTLLGTIQEKFKEHIYAADYYIVRDELKLNLFPNGLLE